MTIEDVRKEIGRLAKADKRVTSWQLEWHRTPGGRPLWRLGVWLFQRLGLSAGEYVPALDDPRTAEEFAKALWDRTLKYAEGWCGQ